MSVQAVQLMLEQVAQQLTFERLMLAKVEQWNFGQQMMEKLMV